MILSRPDILRYLREGHLRITPAIQDDDVDQVSIDLTLGNSFTTFRDLPAHIPAVRVAQSIYDTDDFWDEHSESVILQPGQLVLAHTEEEVTIPGDLAGLVEGRSSWARLGVSIHVTAPKIDPGFSGKIALEMANFGAAPVHLEAGQKPAQLMLLQLSTALEDQELYGSGDGDIFQGQEGPIPKSRS